MTSRQQAAQDAVEAGESAMQAVYTHGLGSPEAGQALTVAVGLTDRATAQGCTADDFAATQRR
jgi:hypothetical protein